MNKHDELKKIQIPGYETKDTNNISRNTTQELP